MAARLPYEVKRLIYGYVDIETLKSLRLVSTSWAAVGLDVLLLPSFIVKSYSIDIPRLISIGSSLDASRQAARVIKKIKFYSSVGSFLSAYQALTCHMLRSICEFWPCPQIEGLGQKYFNFGKRLLLANIANRGKNKDWDAPYLRSIVCSRHSHLSHYEVIDFVPTREEQEALEELDNIIERRHLDDEQERDRDSLIHAFRQAPQATAVEVICPNPFKHRILRKVWEEYNMEAYRSLQRRQGSLQLVDILSAAKQARLEIQHVGHDQLTSFFFSGEEDPISPDIYGYMNGLKSLNLTIYDQPQEFLSNGIASNRLRELISASPNLEIIYIKFELLLPVPLDFLPPAQPCPTKLHTLSLSGVIMDTTQFFSFLGRQVDSLRRLSILGELVNGSWKEFLEAIRDRFGSNLEKFQVSGVLKSPEGGGEAWMLLPIYKADWTDSYSTFRDNRRTKDIEDFVLRGGDWPMTKDDDISSLLT